MIITTRQADILLHMTGLDRREESFRSHFVVEPGHEDLPTLRELESAGLVYQSATPGFLDKSDIVFTVTEDGRSQARRARLERQPKRTKSQERYGFWLGMDGAFHGGFGAWIKAGCPGFDRPWPAHERVWWEVEP